MTRPFVPPLTSVLFARIAHDACATTHLRFGDSEVDARSVQLAYLAALNDGFASVKSVDAILADLS